MKEFIPMELQVTAIALTEEASFSAAARRLDVAPETLHIRIGKLTALLEFPLFRENGDHVEVTREGEVLIDAFRAFLKRRGMSAK
jgi:DNA-binding transcriptional LysR family regulator